jgi:hypothetical protein
MGRIRIFFRNEYAVYRGGSEAWRRGSCLCRETLHVGDKRVINKWHVARVRLEGMYCSMGQILTDEKGSAGTHLPEACGRNGGSEGRQAASAMHGKPLLGKNPLQRRGTEAHDILTKISTTPWPTSQET